MKKYHSNEIRELWLKFWESKGHKIIPSASLIPKNDSSILWINSGVATLKEYFSGDKIPVNPRITNSQKSIRTNDIDNVGVTARHHTLFEMLGNFAINDYFKDKALSWAYEFIFDVLKLKKAKIYITYYQEDKVAYDIWINLGIKKTHLIKGDKKTNFWDVGAGPCGPDSEIFYDRGLKYDPENKGIVLLEKDIENDRYIEIWNIVFSQFNNDGKGNYVELKQKNIDTGLGLERLVSIFQNAPTNFDTDLFLPIIKAVENMTNKKYDINNYFKKDKMQTKINKYFKIIADHMRAVVQAINDGAKPANTQRGYIIRRLIRRSYRSGIQLGIKNKTFLHKLVEDVNNALSVYPVNIKNVTKIIKREEEAFSKTIKKGEKLLFQSIEKGKAFNVKIAFKLFETFGFPIELTKELLEEKGITISMQELNILKEKHVNISRGKRVLGLKSQIQIIKNISKKQSEFIGYEFLESDSKVLFQGCENNKCYVLLDKTPFYATKGGQIHDKGTLNKIEVSNVFKDGYGNHWHVLNKKLNETNVKAIVNHETRDKKAKNHSGTHILGHALRLVIADDIIQLGSENDEWRLRFDFPCDHKPTNIEIKNIENKANELIKSSIPREYIIDSFKNGLSMGALAIDNEIEGDPNQLSRIVKFGKSVEFCGGTHVANTNVVEQIKIIKMESKGSGTYRIEAITSFETINKHMASKKKELVKLLKNIINKNKKIDNSYFVNTKNKTFEELNALFIKAKAFNKQNHKLIQKVKVNFKVSFKNYEGMPTFIKLDVKLEDVKNIAITLREKYPQNLFIIGSKTNTFLVAIASKKYDASKVFKKLANSFKGKGGGSKDFAMGTLEKNAFN